MLVRICLALLAVVIVLACKKKPVIDEPIPPKASDYQPLKTGSYWVYEHFQIDTVGAEASMNKFDSLVVAGDTLINNHTYQVLKNYGHLTNYKDTIYAIVRDSAGFLVRHNGIIFLAINAGPDTIRTTVDSLANGSLVVVTHYVVRPKADVTVPLGTFKAINYQYLITITPSQWPGTRPMNHYYAEGTGLVLSSYFYAGQPPHKYYERRLVRYHLSE